MFMSGKMLNDFLKTVQFLSLGDMVKADVICGGCYTLVVVVSKHCGCPERCYINVMNYY